MVCSWAQKSDVGSERLLLFHSLKLLRKLLKKRGPNFQQQIRFDKKTTVDMEKSKEIYRITDNRLYFRGIICTRWSLAISDVVLGHIASRNRDGWSSIVYHVQVVPRYIPQQNRAP